MWQYRDNTKVSVRIYKKQPTHKVAGAETAEGKGWRTLTGELLGSIHHPFLKNIFMAGEGCGNNHQTIPPPPLVRRG